jgi:hypothetical protein
VLERALAFHVEESEVDVPGGGGIVVPRGAAPTFWNPSREPARYLIVITATTHRLVEAPHDPKRRADMSALPRARPPPNRLAVILPRDPPAPVAGAREPLKPATTDR